MGETFGKRDVDAPRPSRRTERLTRGAAATAVRARSRRGNVHDAGATEEHREGIQRADTRRVLELHAGLDAVLGNPAVPLAQRDPQLQSREMRTEASVDTAPEREMPVDRPVQLHFAGVGTLVVVDVGRADERHHLLAGVHRTTADLGIASRDACHGHDRRLPPQQLLDDARNQVGMFDDRPALIGVLGEISEEAVERRGDRVEARRSGTGSRCRGCSRELRRSPSTSTSRKWLTRSSRRSPARSSSRSLEVRVDRIGRLPAGSASVSGCPRLLADDVVGPDHAVLHPHEPRQLLERAARAASGTPATGTASRTGGRSRSRRRRRSRRSARSPVG